MKLQGLSIIFALVVIPIVLVVSLYIQLQVDTINLQTAYDTKLLDATHDAMVTFEINTANEDLSSVADSLRTIIDASSNIFMNTLSTNLGYSNASKSYVEPYIPAILYTLYDGYYINSPTKVPVILTNEEGKALTVGEKGVVADSAIFSNGTYTYDNTKDNNTGEYTNGGNLISDYEHEAGQILYKVKDQNYYTTNINFDTDDTDTESNIEYKTQNVLKSYIPYSARYIKDDGNIGFSDEDIDISVNYTLDNYVTIVGNIGKIYYTKSGYLIRSIVKVGNEEKKYIQFKSSDGYTDLSGYNEDDAENMILSGTEVAIDIQLEDGSTITLSTRDGENAKNAVIYYTKAKLFSDWVYNNLGSIEERNIVLDENTKGSYKAINDTEELIYDFFEKENKIFDKTQNPEDDNSTFVNHKFEVIKNSIQYNLNLAMSTYNAETSGLYDYNMPVISNSEWAKIINNVSIVTFLQGLNCGLKTYNNYAIVSSTNNELTVIPEEIYYTDDPSGTDNGSETDDYIGTYHRIDCSLLNITDANYKSLNSFKSKEVKYDKIYNKSSGKYDYDHMHLACYSCIVDGNYTKYDQTNVDEKQRRNYVYYIALGKERYNLYKMNAIEKSEGYEVIYSNGNGQDFNKYSTKFLDSIKKIEITFGNIKSDYLINTVSFNIAKDTFPDEMKNVIYTLNTNQTKEQTIAISVNTEEPNKITQSSLDIKNPTKISEDPSENPISIIESAIKSIKIIYK